MNIVSDDVYNKSRKVYEKERPGDIGKISWKQWILKTFVGEEFEDDYLSQLRNSIKHNEFLDSPL